MFTRVMSQCRAENRLMADVVMPPTTHRLDIATTSPYPLSAACPKRNPTRHEYYLMFLFSFLFFALYRLNNSLPLDT
jgi:hypothetical protein